MVAVLAAPSFAAGNLPPASQEADVDPDVASETYVGCHQRLDRYEVRTLVVGVVMAKSVVNMADDGGVALPAIDPQQ
jgi:hypothetical protein